MVQNGRINNSRFVEVPKISFHKKLSSKKRNALQNCKSLKSEIELAIPFVPNRDPPDTPQQSELGEVVHYHPSE
ncbi:hypothetical protein TNCV_4500871 [Trichonephila clavipes]|nr:hypothetical protein TNCV_4500871 [Trichonephila clavipes]